MKWVPTGRTWQQELEGISPEDRRLRWLELGFTFAVQKRNDGTWLAAWRFPDEWQEAIPEIAKLHNRVATDKSLSPEEASTATEIESEIVENP